MTNQEAIKRLTAKAECLRRDTSGIDVDCNSSNCINCEFCYEQGTREMQLKALTIAISALEKQIPMKMPGTYTDYKCAVCGRKIRSGKGSSSRVRDNFCQRCGQAIDWEGE